MTPHADQQPSPEKPVFVDHSGRRRRAYTMIGSAFAMLLVTGLIALLAGAFGADPLRVPGWPDAAPQKPVRTGQPTERSSPSVTETVPSALLSSPSPVAAPTPTPSHGKLLDPPGKGTPGRPSKSPRR